MDYLLKKERIKAMSGGAMCTHQDMSELLKVMPTDKKILQRYTKKISGGLDKRTSSIPTWEMPVVWGGSLRKVV